MFDLKIFDGIEKDVVDKILATSPIEKFPKGTLIFKEGEYTNGKSYIIKSGEAQVILNGQVIAKLGVGEIFGEIALLKEEERNATVRALNEIELIILTFQDLIDMINHDENVINKQIMKRIEENIKLFG